MVQDIYAMGGQPVSALAVAIVPYASDDVMLSDLTQLMAGATDALSKAGCALVGGHSAEGAELALGKTEDASIKGDDTGCARA